MARRKRIKGPLDRLLYAIGPTAGVGLMLVALPAQVRSVVVIPLSILLCILVGFIVFQIRALLKTGAPPAGSGGSAVKVPATSQPSQLATVASKPVTSLTRDSIRTQLHVMDWFQFEKLVELIYLHNGYGVNRSGGANPDGGIDLVIQAPTERFAVQCKHWRSSVVGVRQIREFVGALEISGIKKGVYVTMQGYTDEARVLARERGIVLLEESQIVELILRLESTRAKEVMALLNDTRKFCPKCEREMVLKTAVKGANPGRQFWGCSDYPRCSFTLNLDAQS